MRYRYLNFLSFCVFHSSFVYLDDGSGIGRKIQLSFSIISILMLFKYINVLFNKKFLSINLAVFIYIVSLFFTSFFSRTIKLSTDFHASSYTLGLFYAFTLMVFLLYIELVILKNSFFIVINVFFRLSFIYCIVSDLFFFYGIKTNEGFLIGNKFTLVYTHFFCLLLFILKQEVLYQEYKKKIYHFTLPKIIISLIIILLLSSMFHSSTGILGSIILLIIFVFKKYLKLKLLSKNYIIALIIVFTSFSFLFKILISNDIFKFIIVDILGKDLTLTGRIDIYSVIMKSLKISPYTGVGIGNAGNILMSKYGFANAQNGLLNVVLEQGIFGAISVIYLVYVSFKGYLHEISFPIVSLVVFFIVISCIEITFNINFIYTLILLQPFKFYSKISTHK